MAIGGLVLAQRVVEPNYAPTYGGSTPPRVGLERAYALAIARVGDATNRFWCVSASCVEDESWRWVFWFSNSNGQRARVDVAFAAKEATVMDSKSAALLK